MTQSIRLAVIDDHPVFREGVARCLKDVGFEIAGEGSSKDDAMRIADEQPDIMLIDLSMPGGGLHAIASILERHPSQKIVVLTVSELTDDVTRACDSTCRWRTLRSTRQSLSTSKADPARAWAKSPQGRDGVLVRAASSSDATGSRPVDIR